MVSFFNSRSVFRFAAKKNIGSHMEFFLFFLQRLESYNRGFCSMFLYVILFLF